MIEAPKQKKRVVIAGGGTAGWMTAAAISKVLEKVVDVTLVESDMIGTVGVGEATIPTMLTYNRLLGIDEAEIMRAVGGTFKLGIAFENWTDLNHRYIHSFGITGKDHWTAGFQHFWKRGYDLGVAKEFGEYCLELVAGEKERFSHLPNLGLNYAYHIDATSYAAFLRRLSEQHGTKRIEGRIDHVVRKENGDIGSLALENGERVEGDLFIDCTGFRALLIGGSLGVGYEDWTHWLPCDSAIAVQTELSGNPKPYTRSIAHEAGWRWLIPLQHRMGNGIVYSSRYMGDEQAKEKLLTDIDGEPLTEPRIIRFQTGSRRKHWHRNCIAIGLSSGFIEPLESTSIHLIQRSIMRLMQMFPHGKTNVSDVDEFNAQTAYEVEHIRDFIILHYHQTNRTDSPFWNHVRTMEIPENLSHRMQLFRETGRVFRARDELFAENSWVQVMLGQGIMPESYHPIANMMSEDELVRFLNHIDENVQKTASGLPMHQAYINSFCRALNNQ